ncbi:MAG: hypothetical protein SGBAC_012926 [Bacillariaceae sp.]
MKTSNPRLCLAFYFTSLCWISHGFVHHEKHTVAVPGLKSTQSTIKLRSRLRYSQTYGGKGKNDGSFQLFLDKSECNDQVFELMDGEASADDGAYLEESASGFTDGEVDDTEVTNEADGVFSSVLLLNCVAILWGTQHAVIKTLINDTTPASYSLLRFGLAALIASPYLPKLPSKEDGDKSFDAWRWGSELAIYQFLGFALQAVGLETTTASRSGFLLYLNVKFVPLFAWLVFGKAISAATWISAFAAFIGTALLATDGSEFGFCVGDIWSIAAAATSAMFILRLEQASANVENSSQLNAVCLLVVTILSLIWAAALGDLSIATLSDTVTSHPVELIYLGGIATALTNYLQTRAQRNISAQRASIIYSLDPVYGAFFSWLLLHETLGATQSYIGAAVITVAAAANAFVDFGSDPDE